MKALSSAVASGALDNLETLALAKNRIGDGGVQALATAVASGAMANLGELWLNENQFGDSGMAAFTDAIAASGALDSLKALCIDKPSTELQALCSQKQIKLNRL